MSIFNKSGVNDKFRVLKDPAYCINEVKGVNGVLAGLFRKTLSLIGITPGRFDAKLDQFIAVNKKNNSNRVARMLTRGNLNRELFKPTMSFKVFMKGLKILGIKRVKITIACEYDVNKTYISDVTVDLGNDDVQDLFDEELPDTTE